MNNLLQKANFADVGTIIDSPIKVEPTSSRNESPDLKYENVTFPAYDIEQQMNLSDKETVVYNNNDVNLSDTETVDYTSDIEFLQTRPLHARDRLRQKQKKNYSKIGFFKKVRLARKIKNISTIPHVFNKYEDNMLASKSKNNDELEFI